MKNWLKKNRVNLFIFLLLILGFLIRIYFVNKVIVGDLLSYDEWGKRLFSSGAKNFYFSEGWYYSIPNYPPIAMWVFSALTWVNDKRYVVAQLHNVIKFPPAIFIKYYYDWGNILLMKMPAILCDLGLSVLIYKVIFRLTKSTKKSLIGFCVFLFNPLTIFISGVWGQTDSVVALLGMLSFITLADKKIWLSIPLMFLSLYFKFSWAVLLPFYVITIFLVKPRISHLLFGILISTVLFIVSTKPFSDGNVFLFGWKLFWEKYPIPVGIIGKASISAFNFHTIFWRLDIDFSNSKLLGITSAYWGMFLYLITNFIAIVNYVKQKNKLVGLLCGIFIVGMGSFLFIPTMLERYFFPALPAMVILAFSRPKMLLILIFINIILMANIIYSFYRRGSDLIYHFFIDKNFLLMHTLSVAQVLLFATFTRSLVVQFMRGRSN